MILFIKTKVENFTKGTDKNSDMDTIKVFPELKTSSTNITTLSSISSEDKLQVISELYGLSLSKLIVAFRILISEIFCRTSDILKESSTPCLNPNNYYFF